MLMDRLIKIVDTIPVIVLIIVGICGFVSWVETGSVINVPDTWESQLNKE